MNATVIQADRIPVLGRAEAMSLAATEAGRLVELLESLGPEDWKQQTACERWTVAPMVSHVIEMCTAISSFREMLRQQKLGKAVARSEGLSNFDGWTEWQAQQHADEGSAALVARYRDATPRALQVRGNSSPLRLLRFPTPPYGWFTMAFLRDDILTRDTWMHRIDICRATGREPHLTADHDGRFMANIVADLAARWRRPFSLTLTGPAGGAFEHGKGGPQFTVDAVEFCWILSGRGTGHGLPTDVVPF